MKIEIICHVQDCYFVNVTTDKHNLSIRALNHESPASALTRHALDAEQQAKRLLERAELYRHAASLLSGCKG